MGIDTNITEIYAVGLSYLSILSLPGGTGMERSMAKVVSNDQAGEKELSELISRLRSVAEAMRNLSGDRARLRERLQELKDEVNSVSSRLRRFS